MKAKEKAILSMQSNRNYSSSNAHHQKPLSLCFSPLLIQTLSQSNKANWTPPHNKPPVPSHKKKKEGEEKKRTETKRTV